LLATYLVAFEMWFVVALAHLGLCKIRFAKPWCFVHILGVVFARCSGSYFGLCIFLLLKFAWSVSLVCASFDSFS
ncbi:hypothetical protein U1Q18_031523, partial [Sarracenia purpurea var. burkii]